MRKRERMAHRRPSYGLSINPVPRSQIQKKTWWNHRSVGNPKKCNGGHELVSQVVKKPKGVTVLQVSAKSKCDNSQINYRHPHNPTHVPDHILSILIGTSFAVARERW